MPSSPRAFLHVYLRIARPTILFYGLYNPNLLEQDTMLLDLIMIRGNLATLADTLFPGGGVRGVIPQVLLDMLVTSLDRGIDLLSLGAEPGIDAPTEVRAATYWLIATAIIMILDNANPVAVTPQLDPNATVANSLANLGLTGILGGAVSEAWPGAGHAGDGGILHSGDCSSRLTLVLGDLLSQPRWRTHTRAEQSAKS